MAAVFKRGESAHIGLRDHLALLERTPVSRADLLLGRLSHEIDFVRFDAAMKELEKLAKTHADSSFGGLDGPVTVAGIRDQLREALARAEPYREHESP